MNSRQNCEGQPDIMELEGKRAKRLEVAKCLRLIFLLVSNTVWRYDLNSSSTTFFAAEQEAQGLCASGTI